jgi:hypothetical protein
MVRAGSVGKPSVSAASAVAMTYSSVKVMMPSMHLPVRAVTNFQGNPSTGIRVAQLNATCGVK